MQRATIIFPWSCELRPTHPLMKDKSVLCPLLLDMNKQANEHANAASFIFDVCSAIPLDQMPLLIKLFETNTDLIPKPLSLQLLDENRKSKRIQGTGDFNEAFDEEKAKELLKLATVSSSANPRMYTQPQPINVAEVLLNDPTKLAEFKSNCKKMSEYK